ncbi:MAG TPA: Gfo/Idh/MocA family oxidoreductase [Actinomycetota bacterium]|jgi:myo-inositol 2-dehydrogenase/D-chiro-inositol 1-dehydrogenase|nr:Gfo/Idh/MocA family oxidoreductase [Actinomycetota bacterium]
MRVGLIGAGRIGVLHAGTLADDPRVTGLVVADAEPSRARQVADKVGAGVAAVDELFDGLADAVVIAAPTSTHAELVHRGLDADIPVFCEKPLAADVEGTREVLAHASAGGGSLQVGFQRRFDAGYRAARAAVRDGQLGWIHSVLATTFDPQPPPAEYVATSGGILRDCFIHDFDCLRFVTGREVASAYAVGGNKGDELFAEAGDVDTATVSLLLDDGTVATVLGGRYNGAGYDVRFEVHGSAAAIAVGLDEQVPLRPAEPRVAWPDGRPYANFFERFRVAYATELGEFVAHARGQIPNPCPPSDALEALYVAEAAARSLAERRPVRVDEVR